MTRHLPLLAAFFLIAHPAFSGLEFDPPVSPSEVFQSPPIGGVESPTLSPDELNLYFAAFGDIHKATRTNRDFAFEDPFRANDLSTLEFVEERPFLSPDGLRMYFTRRANTDTKVRTIYRASRPDLETSFSEAVPFGPNGSGPFNGLIGSLSGDELTVYLEVFPDGKGLSDQTDIAIATRASPGQPFGPWTFLNEINTPDNIESDPLISPDEKTILFARVGPGIPGAIVYATRESVSEPFSDPRGVPFVNVSPNSSLDPFLGASGGRLYFTQDGDLVYSERSLDAEFRLSAVQAFRGRDFQIPVRVATEDIEISQFEFNLFLNNPNAVQFLEAIPNEGLGAFELRAEFVSLSVLNVFYRARGSLAGTGNEEEILRLKFHVPFSTPDGTINYGLAGQGQVNGVLQPGIPSNNIQIFTAVTAPSSSLLRFR